MKLYAVNSGSESSFDLKEDIIFGGSNAHSGGAVVLAESLEEAQKMVLNAIREAGGYNLEEATVGTLTEIPLDKAGVVLLANGDC